MFIVGLHAQINEIILSLLIMNFANKLTQVLIVVIQQHYLTNEWTHHSGPGTLTQPLTAVTLGTLWLGQSTRLVEPMETGLQYNLSV